MKQHTFFNRFKVQFFITILAVVFLGANSSALADTVWTAGDTTVTDLLTDSNWSNGAPVTADNPGFINGDVITVSGDYKPGANGQNISLSFTGESRTNLTGTFVPVGNITSGNAAFTMRLEDSASVAVTGNNWVGTNNANNTLKPISGNDYVVSMYFTGSSKYTAFKEWWTAMSVKTLISIEDNATVSALAGNAGFSWCSNANGSLLNMTGGKLLVTADNFWIGDAENTTRYGYATMNQSGGNASIARFLVGQAGSSYNLSNGVMNAGYMTVYSGSNANLTGGTLNLGMLSNEGTTTLAGATVNLATHGFINSTGTFNAVSGAINVKALDGYNYSAGDQILIGNFASDADANGVMALTSVPSGWSKGVVDLEGTKAVIAQYGSAPTGVKVWTSGSTGNLSDGPWTGSTSNSMGYVVGGTNTFNDFAGQVTIYNGTNKFADTAVVHAGNLLIIDGGSNTYGTADIEMNGKLIVNGGSFGTTDNKNFRVYGTEASPAYVEVNGGTLNAPRWLAIGKGSSSTTSAKVVINNGIVQCGHDGAGGFLICDGTGVTAEVVLNGGRLQVNNSRPSNIATNENDRGTFTITNGYFTTSAEVNLGTGKNATGTLDISGGIFVTSNTVSVATGSGSTGIINVSGGEARVNNLKLGRKGAGDDAQLNISGGIFEVTNGLYGSDSSASGNVRITGTGQLLMNSSYSNADYAAIRELSKLEIEGSGNGSGALRFLKSSDSSVPITLTNDATIGIRTDAVFIQRETIDSFVDGAQLTIKGGGTLNLLKEASYNGGTIIDSSIVKLSESATLGSGDVTMTNGTLEFAYADYHAFSNPINGTGSLVKSGAGTTVLSVANSFTGNTHIKQGKLQFSGDAVAFYGPVQVDSEGVLNYSVDYDQTKTLNYNNDVNINGEGSFIKSGYGTLVLNGKHGYSGKTTVSEGELQLTSPDAIARSSAVEVSGSIIMNANQTLNNLTGFGDIDNGGNALTLNNSVSTEFAGGIAGAGSLTKIGSGTLKLSGYYNAYQGDTTVSEGTLIITNGAVSTPNITVSSAGTLQLGVYNIDSNVVVDGGSFIIGETPMSLPLTIGNFSLNNGGQIFFDLNQYQEWSPDMDQLQAGTVALNSGIINLSFNEGETAWFNNATADGYLLITANSGLSFDASNVKVYVDSEESTTWGLKKSGNSLYLVKSGDEPLPVSEYWLANLTEDLAQTSWPIDHNPKLGVKFSKGVEQTAVYTGTVPISEYGSFEIGDGYNLTLSNKVSGSGAMDKIGAGTLTLGATNDGFTGSTKVSEGTLALTAPNAISNSSSVENNAAITMGDEQSLNNLSGTGTIDNGGSALTLNNTAASEFSGVISGEGTLTKSGTGTLTLSGANDYSGATTINAGTLRLTGAGTIGTGGVTNNAIIEFSPAAGETMSITYNINNAAEASKTVKTGAGTLTTSAWINHNVEIKEGTLQITGGIGGNNGKRFNGTVTIDPGATLDCATHDSLGYGASNTVMNIYGTIDTSAGNETLKYTNFHFYGGTAKASGGGTYDICHTNSNFYSHALEGATAENPTVSTVSAGIRLRNSGEGDTFQIVTDANSQLNITGTIINYDTQGVNCPIVKKGEGTLFFTARSTYKGGLTIEEGKVISNAANAGASTYGTGKIVIESKGTLEFQVSNQLGYDTGAPNDIIIRGTFIPSNYTHIKNLTLENGVIEKEYGYSDSGSGMDFRNRTATITSTGNSVIKSRFCIRSNSNVTFDVKDGVLTVEAGINKSTEETAGSAGFTKIGAGTLKVTATGTSNGDANINEGTFLLTSAATLVSNVNVASGATFVDGSNYITSAVTLNGGALTIGETSSTARIVIGDFAVTDGTVNFDFNSASVDYNFDNLSTGAATLTSGIINLTFNNGDVDTWWNNCTDSGYALINASSLTASVGDFQLLVNSAETQQWYLDTAGNSLVLKKLGSEPPTPTDNYYRANTADINLDSWTIDGTNKLGATFTEGGDSATFNGGVTLNADGEFEVGTGRTLTVSNVISGEGSLTKTGNGTLTLSGDNTYTGDTTVSAGTLNLTKTGQKGTLATGSTLTVDGENSVVTGHGDILGYTSGTVATVNLTNGGTLHNDSTGNHITVGAEINMNSGVISSENGNGSSTFGNYVFDNAINVLGGTDNAITANRITLRNLGDAGAGKITVAENAKLTISSQIFDPDGNFIPLVKQGAGTLVLSGDNTYTKGTNVNEGVLQLTGAAVKANSSIAIADNATLEYNVPSGEKSLGFTSGSANVSGGNVVKTGAGKLKINANDDQFTASAFTVSAGELDFLGTYKGSLEVQRGATLSAGNSPGDLTVYGDVKIDAGATGLFEFSSFTADKEQQVFDQMFITGASSFILDPGATIKLSFLNGDASAWSTADDPVYQLVFDENFVSETTDLSEFLETKYQGVFALEGTPEGLFLRGLGVIPVPDPGTGVPEPSTWALMILGALGLLYWRKKNA